jgi:hypoxanthine phosphoribosyltransferase
VHASRYGDSRQGGAMHWKVAPHESVRNRVVLLVDDILDEGHTLAAIRQRVLALGAQHCYMAVFADKQHGRAKPVAADFVGLHLPDRFVFGYGMDIEGAWRNLPAIYAVKEQDMEIRIED